MFIGIRILKFETIKNACFHIAKDELGVNLRFDKFILLKESIFSSEVTSVNTINIFISMFYDYDEKIVLNSTYIDYS